MKLSMWMLMKWFEADKPNAVILEGEQAIEGVRFYTDGDLFDDRYLYVCRMSDIYSSSAKNSILIVFRNDTMSFSSDDPNEIFNRVIEAFEFYNEWERRLLTATMSESPEQDIVDSCKGLLGPIFIMDNSMSIVASTSGYLPGEINDFWDIVVLGNGFPDIGKTVGSNFSRMHFVDHDCTMFEDDSASPYRYGISSSVHGSRGEVMGQMVIASDRQMGHYEMQLAHIVTAAIDSVRFRREGAHSLGYSESLLTDLLEGHVDPIMASHTLMLLQEWKEDDTLYALRLEPADRSDSELASLKRLLQLAFPESAMIVRNQGVEGVVRVLGDASANAVFGRLEKTDTYRVGLSNCFRPAEHIPLFMRQAGDALRYSPSSRHLCPFRMCGLNVMTHTTDRQYAILSAHPAIRELAIWDTEHNAQLSKTLNSFLVHERSYAKTSKALYVHRNTVLYRIEKACEIASLDLDDPYERLYLMMSFLVCDAQ